MIPAWIQVVFAGITLLFLLGGTLVGASLWIVNRIDASERRIMEHFDSKHGEMARAVHAMSELLIRHDTLLNQEFGEPMQNGRHSHLRRS